VLIYLREKAAMVDIRLSCDHTPTEYILRPSPELVDVTFYKLYLYHFTLIFMFYVISNPLNTAMYLKLSSQLAWYVVFTDINISP